jgi:3-hydroxyacyl-CoA dehydrogenase
VSEQYARYPSLSGRRVLVTGGASGIGASIVAHFVAQGSHVGFLDLDATAAAGVLASHPDARVGFRQVDLRDIAALRTAIAALREELGGPFTVLVNNAARDDRHAIDDVTPEYWDDRFATNLRHQFFCAQAVKDGMIEAGGGSIINMSSNSFLLASGGMPAYTAAKSGVIGLTRGLARDLGPHKIRANIVYPGWIMTERQLELWMTPEGEKRRREGQCLPERIYADDVARMVLWLAADDSAMVTMSADYELRGDVAVITIRNPPVNALSAAVRSAVHEGIARAVADDAVAAIVLIGDNGFVAGADIREFGKPQIPPSLRDLYPPMEASPKPIVAAIAGNALGGGLELAMACHYRIASPGARMGLPEVNIGLLPGGGGTVRLPRLIGAGPALDMMLSGKPVAVPRALELGIIDAVVEGDLFEEAVAYARAHVGGTLPVVSARKLALAEGEVDLFQTVRAKNATRWRGLVAPFKIVECVEHAVSEPFDAAYAFEEAAFRQCMESPASAALRHAFFAEREAAKIPGIGRDVTPRPIRSAGVIGAGTMGGGIAMALANAGIPVVQLDMDEAALARGRATIEKNYATSVSRGSMTEKARDQALSLIRTTTDYEALAGADIVIEAAFEEMGVKQTIFGKLDAVMQPGAILATNTSTLDIDAIASATNRPADVVGTHFFSPANVMKLQENVRGAATSPEVIASVTALAKRIGKVPVLSGNCDGFIGNRILAVYGEQADFLLEEGATPWQIDDALIAFGFPMGIYRMRDLAGLDVGWRIRQGREAARDKSLRYSVIADRLCEAGRFGQKTGIGYYRYEGRTPIPEPETQAIIEQASADAGITRAPIADDEIVTRVLTAMVNEAAKILGEGIALRASDIDVVYLNGYGFPRHQGGPMFWGARRGLPRVLADIRRYHAAHGAVWTPAPLLIEREQRGEPFPE